VRSLLFALLCSSLMATADPADAQQSAPPPQASPGEEVPAATLAVEIDPTTVTIGDRFQARLELRSSAPLGGQPRFPAWEEHWGDAEILAVDPPRDEGGGLWSQRLTLAVFEIGLATLPAVEVEVPTAATTTAAVSAPVVVRVDSVLPATDEEIPPQPPEPLHELPAGRRFWIAAAALGLACLVLGFVALRRVRHIHSALEAMALSPIEAFDRALARLRSESLAAQAYTGLSLELRRYLGRRLTFPAAEGTTTQIQRSLRERKLPAELLRETLDLLREADQVKFARGAADPGRVRRRLDEAESLALAVENWLEPAPEQDEAAA